jgi:hypothetical protein
MVRQRTAGLATIALLCATAVFVARPAPGSEVSYRKIPLARVLQRSQLVVVVKRAKPASTREAVDITPPNKTRDRAKVPPYTRVVERFEVLRVLYPRAGSPGKTIEVVGANDEYDLQAHRRYYVDGVSESPIHERYQSPTNRSVQRAATMILFLAPLSKNARRHRFVVEQALEAATEEQAILRALATAHPPTRR